MKPITGVLVVDKPSGMTSHDVVAQARRLFGQRSVGHAGTLDPMATGVLLLLFGEATKLSTYLAGEDKSYEALVQFGRATDTLDAEGNVLAERAILPAELSDERLAGALAGERLRLEQVPPAVSALKVGGKAAHRLSRQGQRVELAARPVRVRRLEMTERGADWMRLSLCVSKGYYVRALARDLGDRLSLPACLAELRRSASGAFTLPEAVPWPPPVRPELLSLATAASRCMPVAKLTEAGAERARHGKPLEARHFVADPTPAAQRSGALAWLDPAGDLIAIGHFAEGAHVVRRGFGQP